MIKTDLDIGSLDKAGASAPSSAFFHSSLKVIASRLPNTKVSSGSFIIVAQEIDESKHTDKDRWRSLAYDTSEDQQDITREKGMVDSLFQALMDAGTHYAVMSSYQYISTRL
ncbi:Ribulose bisphosphate carboxylase/oxygenase activase [Spatholobus suberectus]|nr:Ribulose bisphosphate carboxylase/oxygenase activase [Spatholobus suberectus]